MWESRSPRSLPVPFKEVQSSSREQKSTRMYLCSTGDIKSLFSRPQCLTFSFTVEFNFPYKLLALEKQHSPPPSAVYSPTNSDPLVSLT